MTNRCNILDKKNDNKSEKYTEYVFSENCSDDIPYFDSKISAEKMKVVFNTLRKKYGVVETINDYSIYSHNDLELKVYVDGSSFCKRVSINKTNNNNINNIYKLSVIKQKVNNDIFPCKYSYDSVLDIIDIKFTISDNICIVLRTLYENNRFFEKTNNIKKIGLKSRNIKNINKSNKYWCTISIITLNGCDENIIRENIEMILSNFPVSTT